MGAHLVSVILAALAVAGWALALRRAGRANAPAPAPASPVPADGDHTRVGFAKALETMQLGVTITDTHGRILYTNPADAAMHGYTAQELIGQDVRIFAPSGSSRPLGLPELNQIRSWQREALNVRKDGSRFPVHLMSDVVRSGSGEIIGVVTTCQDITERKEVEQRMAHDALYDALTGLPNRGFFMDLLGHAMKRTKRRRDYLFGILFLDIDRFKLVNDSLGHNVGDDLLVGISRRVQQCLRPGDVVARLGGDEFGVLLDDVGGAPDATRVAERIQTELKEPFLLEGHEVFTTASIGIALNTEGHDLPEYLLRDADTAMFRAKARGRACSEMFDEAMHARAVAQLRLESDLRRALEREEFRLWYQPIMSLSSGGIIGFEALIRWQHPERGLVTPGEFIPLAEETGLVVPLGRWVMLTACRQTRAWIDRFPGLADLSVSVNLSARHFQQPDLIDQIQSVLSQTGLPATSLKLEITESMLMENPESHVEVIRDLRRTGVQVQIDDFGTGYSSLSYLQRFAVDTLKIDRSFLGDEHNREAWDIVGTIITLARDLGVAVIAEGVETEEQTLRLKALRCEQAQGYVFKEPVDADAAGSLLAAQLKQGRSGAIRV